MTDSNFNKNPMISKIMIKVHKDRAQSIFIKKKKPKKGASLLMKKDIIIKTKTGTVTQEIRRQSSIRMPFTKK